jgi:PhnB protein
MSRVSIYLNTMGQTEEQFRFYAEVFGSEISNLQYMADVPGAVPLPNGERNAVMHIEVVITGGTVLMGTDLVASMGHRLVVGNNMAINLEPDTLDEGRRLFDSLSDGATEVVPFELMFWGAHWGSLLDRYGIRWMVNVPSELV